MKLVQVKLECDGAFIITYVDTRKVFKVGDKITLKEYVTRLWDVREIYSEMDSSKIHTDWCVGGITERMGEK
jgi:hypothetical protein